MKKKTSYNFASEVEFVNSGDDFFERANKIIRNSLHKIHLQTYIFSDDSTGLETIKLLTGAVERGVEVNLLIDAFGSHELKSETIETIKECGINFRMHSPLFKGIKLHFGRRLHHKILIADGKEALIGGINFDDKYRLKGADTPWLDFAVYVKGNICDDISDMCERLWSKKGYFRRNKKASKAPTKPQGILVKLQQNDWLYRRKGISTSIINALRSAQSSVTLVESYFLPGTRTRVALKNASKRNVKVRVILPGVSDVKVVKNATSYWYAWLLRNNIEIYEWNKTILHGKLIVVDNDWVSIGSYNINHLSHFSSIETNVEVKDKDFRTKVSWELDRIIQSSKKISNVENEKRANPLQMFLWWSSFQFVRFMFRFQYAILSKE